MMELGGSRGWLLWTLGLRVVCIAGDIVAG